MKNKKRNLIIFCILLLLIIVVVGIYLLIPKEKEEIKDREIKVNNNGFLTIMLEQDDGTYKKSTSNTWPGDGYAFNNELSGCERGGELLYDRETNIVKLTSSGSDKCYAYFDKYVVAKITNVTSTKTTNSVTLTVTTEAGENPIDKYYFSRDDGQSYQESTSNTYTFSNLNYGTTYTFKVYAKDTLGYETNEESIEVTTDSYVNPTVNSVTITDTTTSSINVSVSASGGTNNVATYYYSINNGSYTSSTSSSYTFSGLSKGTTYTIKVYVKDANGVDSNLYSKSVITNAFVNQPVVNSVTVTGTTTSSISVSVNASGGTYNIGTYYYSINNGAYSSSTSNTKTFTGLSAGTTYTIKVYVKDTVGVSSSVKTTSVQTESLTYICTTGTNLATCIKNQYTSQGANGLYYHTSSLANSAADNSYRYAGANPNNYVCFGSTASTCPSDNLYRIIGVFGSEVKLIKATYVDSYFWSGSSSNQSNTWSSSTLNTGTLNGTYLSGLSATWQNKIATHTWYVRGYSTASATPKTWYNAESSGTTYRAKIGLMYVSDYGYAASNSYWTTNMNSYDSAINNNWMNIRFNEWTISRVSSSSDNAFVVVFTGTLGYANVYNNYNAFRPVFYLRSSTTYVSGSGTSSDPIRIN